MIALKDGVGILLRSMDIVKNVGDRLMYIGGFPPLRIFAEAYYFDWC